MGVDLNRDFILMFVGSLWFSTVVLGFIGWAGGVGIGLCVGFSVILTSSRGSFVDV